MARRRLGALAAIGVARAAAAAASATFPEYALDLDMRLGFPDVDAVALRRKNRRRVDALKKFEPKVCDATVPYPPRTAARHTAAATPRPLVDADRGISRKNRRRAGTSAAPSTTCTCPRPARRS